MKIGRGGARYDKKGKLLTGRKKAKEVRVTTSISMFQRYWEVLDKIGPSRGKAAEKVIDFYVESNKCDIDDVLLRCGKLRKKYRNTEYYEGICRVENLIAEVWLKTKVIGE